MSTNLEEKTKNIGIRMMALAGAFGLYACPSFPLRCDIHSARNSPRAVDYYADSSPPLRPTRIIPRGCYVHPEDHDCVDIVHFEFGVGYHF